MPDKSRPTATEEWPSEVQLASVRALGMRVCESGRDYCVMQLPYDKRFVGYPDTGVLAGGIITTALDDASGAAAILARGRREPVATVTLRIDYMRPAEAGRDVFVRAHCFHVGRLIAFVRGAAYHDTPDDPIATSVGTFMFTQIISPPETRES
jgi:uncharacterized protein (TIGR00369 family)